MEQKLTPSWLFWLPLLVSLGILTYFALPVEPKIHYAWGIVAVVGLYLLSRKYMLIAIYIAAVLLGFVACVVRTSSVASPVLPYKIEDVWIKGKVEEIQYATIGARLTMSHLWVKNLPREKTPLKVKVTVRTNIGSLVVGDVVVFRGTLMPPPGPSIPGGFDYQRFAYYQQVGGIGYAMSRPRVKQSMPINAHFIEKMRQSGIARIGALLPQPAASIASGMLLGDTSYLKQQVYGPVKVAGIAHVIAISGMHMVVVVSIIFITARWLCGLSRYLALHFNIKKIAALLAIVGSLFYLILAGNPVSAQRAYIMSAMVLLAIVLDRNNQPLHSLAVACTLLLLATPEVLLNPSLQMSVAACFGLICSYRVLHIWLPMGQGWFRKGLYYGINIAATTLVAGMFTAPFIVYHFHQFSTYSVLANLMAIPLTDFILMPMGMIGLVLMPVGLEKMPFLIMEYGINFLLWIAMKIAALPAASIFVPAIADYAMLMFSYGAIVSFIGVGKLRLVGCGMVAFSVASLLWNKMPDIVVDGRGKLFAVRYDGDYYFSDKRSNRFTRKVWQESLGENSAMLITDVPGCEARSCAIMAEHPALVTKYPRPQDCQQYRVIIDLSDNSIICEDAMVITLKQLAEGGSHMVWLYGGSPVVKKAVVAGVARPWSGAVG